MDCNFSIVSTFKGLIIENYYCEAYIRFNSLPISSSGPARVPRISECRWYTVFRYWWRSVFGTETLMNRCTVFLSETRSRGTVFQSRMSTFRLRAVVTTHLYHALEVDVHTVGEFEGLEVCEADNGGAWAEVLYLLEPATDTNNCTLYLVPIQ